ncbi:hypothetical protein B7Y94_04435 [Candidatus Saccharibacteria bacterium 32-49-12]|nr:MAG: hypothetical protein B7Y94_04435 [Candidatus Saccharibacteria bacterium 32-49-12]
MGQSKSLQSKLGFALPTVLIASVVLMAVLALAVTATTSVRTSLKNQYYSQLAKVAGEAGVEYAKACLEANNNAVTWTVSKPLTPGTDCYGNSNVQASVDALIVAGGGGGGRVAGGGGGGGGVKIVKNMSIAVQNYSVVVGGGGAYASSTTATGGTGANSSFNGVTSNGGGGGASFSGTLSGRNGGSGGGASGSLNSPMNQSGTGIDGQGFGGGSGYPNSGCTASGGGGGGAGSAGLDGSPSRGGNGGPGVASDITGTMLYYGSGGAGHGNCGTNNAGIPGPEGFRSGDTVRPNTGHGGAGGSATAAGTSGASGVVIISYPASSGITATGGTISSVRGMRIHRFTSSGTFAVTAASVSCPNSSQCWVMNDGSVRSSFSVPPPTLDSAGRPTLIAQTGYVELIRASDGAVWRTYQQEAIQPAAVPELCSGATPSNLGWSNATVTTASGFGGISKAKPISNTTSSRYPGPVYFRKDFFVPEEGRYTVKSKADDIHSLYVNGALMHDISGWTTITETDVYLQQGCNSIMASVVNGGALSGVSNFTLNLTRAGDNTEVMVTDESWRVTAGELVDFSEPGYYPTTYWVDVTTRTGGVPGNWPNYSNSNTSAQWMVTPASLSGTSSPNDSYTYLRTKNAGGWSMWTATDVQLAVACDDACSVFVDGAEVLKSDGHGHTSMSRINLSKGPHMVGIKLYNSGTAANPAAVLFSAHKVSGGTRIDESGSGWIATNAWWTTAPTLLSYDALYRPSPDIYDCQCDFQGATNLFRNPSFETSNFDNISSYGGGMSNAGEPFPGMGTSSLQSYVSDSGEPVPRFEIGEQDGIEPGQVYTISGYMHSPTSGRVGYMFLDSSYAAIPVNGVSFFYGPTTTLSGEWDRLSVTTIPAPAGTMSIRVRFALPGAASVGTIFKIDGTMMTAGPSLHGYADGTVGGVDGWRWRGSTGLSRSSGPTSLFLE